MAINKCLFIKYSFLRSLTAGHSSESGEAYRFHNEDNIQL